MAQTALGTVAITVWPGTDQKIVSLPIEWRPRLRLGPRDQVWVRAGNRRMRAEAVFTDEKEVQMTDSVREALYLPQGDVCAKAQDGELCFGPFVGLYALLDREPGKRFGELTTVFRDMMELAQLEGVVLYVFTPGSAQWEEGYTPAYVWRDGAWKRTKRPLPDLVLMKIMGTPPEWRDQMRRDQTQMARRVSYGNFSHAVGSKWEVHQTLERSFKTRGLLPETRLIRAPLDVEELLRRHGAVYVKPTYGTQGRSIYRLEQGSRGIRVQYTAEGQTQNRRMQRGSAAWQQFLQKKFCAKRQFLVQQALDLVKAEGVRPVDFRWLIQKDGQNRWRITARVARIGHRGSITTNLHTGGDAVLAETFLQGHGYGKEKSRRELLEHFDQAAFRVAEVLEQKAGRIGEIGIDFGLTQQTRIFLIEVNPRPGRQMLKDTAPETRELSLRRNLEYAKLVTGFGMGVVTSEDD
jgi:hypothetical protein